MFQFIIIMFYIKHLLELIWKYRVSVLVKHNFSKIILRKFDSEIYPWNASVIPCTRMVLLLLIYVKLLMFVFLVNA